MTIDEVIKQMKSQPGRWIIADLENKESIVGKGTKMKDLVQFAKYLWSKADQKPRKETR